MKLYRDKSDENIDMRCQQLKRASGISSKHLPHGFNAIASFDMGDIYVDDAIFIKMSTAVRRELDDCVLRFLHEDYGELTEDEQEQNGESKYFGDGGGMIARYKISIGLIEFQVDENTMISLLT